jgi:tripartite-type tricarboxylate transporter receptor subunit TctC
MLPIPPAAPYLQDGGLVALGVSTARRSGLLPDVPPLTQAGVAGFDFPIWYGIWAPAQTPAGIVSTLARDIADTLATAELSEWLTQHDADPMRMSPAEFGAFVVSEAERADPPRAAAGGDPHRAADPIAAAAAVMHSSCQT